MSLWQQVQEAIINTAHSTKAIAVDSVETFQHHKALSLNKRADTIRQSDSHIEGSEAAVEYFKQKARIASHDQQHTAAYRLNDENRRKRDNRLIDIYDVVTSDVETLKEVGDVLWGYIKTADTLARATVNDTKEDIQTFLESADGQSLKQASEDTLVEIFEPLQQTWQQTTDAIRALDLQNKTEGVLELFQHRGRDR